MIEIARNPAAAEGTDFDLIVVGGGVYGLTLTLEAARRGYRPLLLEQNDFNAGTSWNSLRIVHGGLRYLQSLDLRRFFESVSERRWFFQHFPDLVGVLPCLMPLYNRGMKRRATMFAALKLNDTLSLRRNVGVNDDVHLPHAKLMSTAQTQNMFPGVDRDGLKGAANWFDGVMLHHQRLMMETLRWAVHAGATALNYCRADAATVHGGDVTGVEATDRVTGKTHTFSAPVVVNAAGPSAADFARTLDAKADVKPEELVELFRPSLAFNLLLDHAPLSSHAVAIEPKTPTNPQSNGGKPRTYFVLPWTVDGQPRVLAGTFHAPLEPSTTKPEPTEAQIHEFLADLNAASPGLSLQRAQVMRIYAGLLPAEQPNHEATAHRPVWVDHGQRGGPVGAFSVSGVKYTTARLVGEQTLRRVFGSKLRDVADDAQRPPAEESLDFHTYRTNRETPGYEDAVRRVATLESAVYLDDMLHRRSDWGADPAAEAEAREDLRRILNLPEAPPRSDTAPAAA
ncbi:MAG: FAD-dependent oxidoreductase [Planctomycetota bacterium]